MDKASNIIEIVNEWRKQSAGKFPAPDETYVWGLLAVELAELFDANHLRNSDPKIVRSDRESSVNAEIADVLINAATLLTVLDEDRCILDDTDTPTEITLLTQVLRYPAVIGPMKRMIPQLVIDVITDRVPDAEDIVREKLEEIGTRWPTKPNS